MADTPIIVIDGSRILAKLDSDYERKHSEWHLLCSAVRAGFKKKTSRTIKNGKEYEYTNWYMEQPGGGLKSVGKEEPDYSKYYPSEPKPLIMFKFQEYWGHVLLEEKDYIANQTLFRDCLVFKLEECMNYIHPLYKDPNKAIKTGRKSKGRNTAKSFTGDELLPTPNSVTLPDELEGSVRKCGVSSEISSGEIGQKKDEWRCPIGDTCDMAGCPPNCSIILSRSRSKAPVQPEKTNIVNYICQECNGREYNLEGNSKTGFKKVCRKCGYGYPYYPSCKTEKDEKGRCIVLTGMLCPVLCCMECQNSCNSRCSNSMGVF